MPIIPLDPWYPPFRDACSVDFQDLAFVNLSTISAHAQCSTVEYMQGEL